MRARGSSGPSISGSGRMDGTAGTAEAGSRPDACSSSSASASPPSVSLISQIPIPSTPAAAYACTSAAKLDARVVICEIEKRGRMQGILCLSGANPSPQPLRERRPQKFLCDERSRARPEPGTGPGARSDVEEPPDGRAVAGLLREGAPEEVLVERERARVGIAALEVDV